MVDLPHDLIEALRAARSVVALTGSGISAESGIPTFREAQTGLWERYDPQELATPEAFMRDPELVWNWYAWRRELVGRAEPNPGHHALAQMERDAPTFALITQNVDGLHQEAGSDNVVELHGNIRRTRCSSEGLVVEPQQTDETPPVCTNCGAMLRPDVVWFGEMLPGAALVAAAEAIGGCDVFLSIGTSSLVYPAAGLPYEALAAGAVLVEVNPNETPLTAHTNWSLRGSAGEILPGLARTTHG